MIPSYYFHSYDYGALSFLLGLLLIAMLVFLVVSIINHRTSSSPGQIFRNPSSGEVSPQEDLLSIAQRRLAMGEINASEYDDIVARINTKPKGSSA